MPEMPSVEALVCAEPGRLALVRRPVPTVMPGEALVRPRRIGVCGTDYHIYQGKHPYLQYPRIMGHEMAVEVVEPPSGSALRVGDICVVNPYVSCGVCIACRAARPNCCVNISVLGVHRDGGMTGLVSIPERNLIPAGGLSLDACASTEFLAIGAHAVRRGAIAAGDNVLVIGAGPIGLGAVLFAGLAGANAFVHDRDTARAAAAAAMSGATAIADPKLEMAGHTGGYGFDVVMDATGNRASMEAGFDFVAHGGRYVLISLVNETISFADPDFHRKEMTLFASRNATNDDFRRVMQAIGTGVIKVDQLVTHRTSLAGAAQSIPLWAMQKSGLIKALVEIDG
ncbi:zinc-binding alcohol dehydrogenase family protein [Dongia rigui]|uniref:Zinc-binding alcohol dehydrogenase family protein n=1 Tax=Dongia rigui TaxID=940149 RepID=A0ABU5E228_9PROT|nr:zinc-binding alcohol dehydrogenase family protein [Dongia rigui]MDY0873611.1 zinc-binding alcohol dehydrogenase family protein [Dongia rigui]